VKTPRILGIVAAVILLGSCAIYSRSTFSQWSGPSVFRGSGGAKRTVDGVDIWTSGSPHQRFQLLGFVEQTNVNDGSALAVIASMTSEQALAEEAKRAGGDALIFVSANSGIVGWNTAVDYGGVYGGPYSGRGPLRTTAVTAGARKVAVIKYLPRSSDTRR
jgi:hypothetical protein